LKRLIPALVVAAAAYVALHLWGSVEGTRDDLIEAGGVLIATYVFGPLLEFAWNFACAPWRILRDEVEELRSQLPDQPQRDQAEFKLREELDTAMTRYQGLTDQYSWSIAPLPTETQDWISAWSNAVGALLRQLDSDSARAFQESSIGAGGTGGAGDLRRFGARLGYLAKFLEERRSRSAT
jgi:hypothetical protein